MNKILKFNIVANGKKKTNILEMAKCRATRGDILGLGGWVGY